MILLLVAALALALAANAVQAAVDTRSADPRGAAGTAALGGAVLAVTLIVLDGGRILRWRYSLGAGADRLELPGAALVLGLALLVALAGTLAMAAHLLSSGPAPRARLLGQRLLVLAAGLAGLGLAVVVAQGLGRGRRALATGALDLGALLVSTGLLVLGLTRLLAPVTAQVAAVRGARRERLLRGAAALALVAAAAAGVASWRMQGSYATPAVAEAVSVAVLGLAAVQPTRFALLRGVVFLLGLVAMIARTVRPG
jgi:hypothetical protein